MPGHARDAADQQSLLVGKPADGGAHQRIDRQTLKLLDLAVDRADPQAALTGASHRERETLPIHGPRHVVDFRVRRHSESRRRTVRDPDQAGEVPPWRP